MFGRKKSSAEDGESTERQSTTSALPTLATTDVPHGPLERSDIPDLQMHFDALGFGYVDLGSMVIGIPAGRDLNVALSPAGLPEFHVVSQVARVIPHVYAAPKSAGQWRSWVTELRTALEQQASDVSIFDGKWGRELHAEMPGAVFQVFGVDGPRWMAEVRVMSTPQDAEAAGEQGREILRHLVISRGSEPMPVREHLPVSIPEDIQQALVQAQTQMAEQQRAEALQQQMAAGQQVAANPVAAEGGTESTAASTGSEAPNPATAPRRTGSAMDSLRGDDL